MQDKAEILNKIDAAIDAGDLDEINARLDELSAMESLTIRPENAKLFAARLQKLNKEKNAMIRPNRPIRIAIVAAAVMLMGLTVYAATALNLFNFQQGNKFVTMRTTENMTEQEAKKFAGENVDSSVPDGATILRPDTKDFAFETVEQAQEMLDMKIAMPSDLPDMELESADGTIASFGDDTEKRTLWLNYSDKRGRMFGITTVREVIKPGAAVTGYTIHDIDDGSLGKYKSKSGIEYIILTESDETGEKTAHIATVMIGEYEYALVFFGFEEDERHEIIDSVDLSIYR